MIYSPRQRIMVNYLYDVNNVKTRILTGEAFINHFISSEKKEDTKENIITQRYRFFPSKKVAFKRVNEFFEVLDDLSEHKIIDVHKNPDKKHIIKFILKEPRKEEKDFTEFHEIFDEYITAHFEIIDQLKFDRFIKQKYLHDFEYQDKRFKDIHIWLAKILIALGIASFLMSFFIDLWKCNNSQKISIENKSLSSDTLNVKINNPIIIETDSTKTKLNN